MCIVYKNVQQDHPASPSPNILKNCFPTAVSLLKDVYICTLLYHIQAMVQGILVAIVTIRLTDNTQLLNYSITQLLNYSITQLLNYSITQLLNYSITQLLNYSITQLLNYSITQLLNYSNSSCLTNRYSSLLFCCIAISTNQFCYRVCSILLKW